MNKAAVYHVPQGIYACAEAPDCLRVRLKLAKGDASECKVYYKNVYDHGPEHKCILMKKVAQDDVCEWFEADLILHEKRFKYFFNIISSTGGKWYYTPDGVCRKLKTPREYFCCPYLFEEDVPVNPEWAKGALIYQVFVDRFCNGDNSNDPPRVREWDELPDKDTFYGGDFSGLKSKLKYISSLGTGVLYLNPVFLSDTCHKYDINNYYAIDPAFGSVEELKELVKEAHELGMKVVLDAVFNHCSDKNPLFTDVVEKGKKSKYYSWFSIKSFPIIKNPPNYDSFAGMISEMPRLNTSNTEVQDYLITSAEYWTKFLGIDGWRLDVADEISHVFWRLFRKRLRKIRPDIFIIGEVWNRATRWLTGDEHDSVTNYKFRKIILEFVNNSKMSNTMFWDAIAKNEMNYKTSSLPLLINLVGSHDTMRLINAVGGDVAAANAVLGVMLTFSGMPLIYYGDEVGMQGDDDPDNRRAMIWDESRQDRQSLFITGTLGNARREYPALRNGTLIPQRDAPSRVLAYMRKAENGNMAIIAANFSNVDQIVHFDIPCCKSTPCKKIYGVSDYSIGPCGILEIIVPSGDIAVLEVNSVERI